MTQLTERQEAQLYPDIWGRLGLKGQYSLGGRVSASFLISNEQF